MNNRLRQVYIISDLHIGGEYPGSNEEYSERGFRLCTHIDALTNFVNALAKRAKGNSASELIINGDFIDFLAERSPGEAQWMPFIADPMVAIQRLVTIVDRDAHFFKALTWFLQCGHRLVILLGNHDIELSLPQVRRKLQELLAVQGHHDFQFIYDGEAYRVADALIEHGNRYDKFNVVDFDGLRRFRSLLSRQQEVPEKYSFDPPAGSQIVATIINPIKEDYRVIDLLKPETGAVIPLLLALEPGYRRFLGTFCQSALKSWHHRLEGRALPSFGGDIHAVSEDPEGLYGGDLAAVALEEVPDSLCNNDGALKSILSEVMGGDAEEFFHEIKSAETRENGTLAEEQVGGDIAWKDVKNHVNRGIGIFRLLVGKKINEKNSAEYERAIEKRLPLLLKALQCLQNDKTFSLTEETAPEYINAAEELAQNGIRYVIFGHTHLAKRVVRGPDCVYLNSGTWSDLMQFPRNIFSASQNDTPLNELKKFVDLISKGDLSSLTIFRPTYIRLDVDSSNKIVEADVLLFENKIL